MIIDNIYQLERKISFIYNKLGKKPEDITIVAVTKFADVDSVEKAITAGLTNFGENKVQQAKEKYHIFDSHGDKITKHMIGHLQTNKVKDALQIFDVIQSVDSLKLSMEIEKQASKLNKVIEIFIQVNTSGDEQKFGIDKTEVKNLIDKILELKHIRIVGLMTIAPFSEDKELIRQCFRDLKEIKTKLEDDFKDNDLIKMKYLSMGMTDDYEIAIEEGSNMIRIGRAIFT